MNKILIGIVGCGTISQIYIENLNNRFLNTLVVAVSDINQEAAAATAEKFNIKKVLTFDEMLVDPDIQMVINLTIPREHYSLTKRVILAGKHAYLEKPFAFTYEEANELMQLAEKNNVMVGCAPDTFLGAGYQTARKVIDSGLIGDVISAQTFDFNHGHENWHPSPEFYYDFGGGPDWDKGPYYLTGLISLIGPVKTVAGMTSKSFEERVITSKPKYGKVIDVKVPTHVNSMLRFECGVTCVAVFSFDVWGTTLPFTEIHGTLGSLRLPDANEFDGDVLYKSYFSDKFEKIPPTHVYAVNSRGIGASDMAQAILEGRKSRLDGSLARHVVEITEAIHKSNSENVFIDLKSRCERPSAMPMGLNEGYI